MSQGGGPKVSVLTPTFNHERYIRECVNSVRSQSYENWEQIVVDDGSTDLTVKVVQGIQDPRIKLVRQEHLGIDGLARTYNRALEASTGDLIAILEGDDYWAQEKLEVQVPDFEDPDVVLSAGRFMIVTSDGEPRMVSPETLPPKDALENEPVGRAMAAMLSHKTLTFAYPVTTVIRRAALERIGGFQQPDYLPIVDYPTFLLLSLEGKWVFHDRLLGFWRRHDSSTTLSNLPWILSGVHRYAAEVSRAHREQAGIGIEEAKRIETDWRYFQLERAALAGRWLCSMGRWREARAMFRRSLSLAQRRNTKLMLLAALLSSALRRSPEFAFTLGRRGCWEDGIALRTGDRLVSPDMSPEDFTVHSFVD